MLLLALLLEPVTARVTVGWEGRVVAVNDREDEEEGTEKEEESFELAAEWEEVEGRR